MPFLKVTVCGTLSLLVQVTVVPIGTWRLAGWNFAVIVIVTWVTPTTGVGVGLAMGVGGAVGVVGAGTVALPPPQLTNSTTQTRSSKTRKSGCRCVFTLNAIGPLLPVAIEILLLYTARSPG